MKGRKARFKNFVVRNAAIYNMVRNGYTMIAKASLKLETDAGIRRYNGLGFSSCLPGDLFDRTLGRNIAKGRATRDIALQMLADGLLPSDLLDHDIKARAKEVRLQAEQA